ncbi:MAG TPA: glycosyltransferase family 4 protein [Vicinamibacteria bacterium]
MKILALVPSEKDVNPGQRFRIEQWEPLLKKRGVELTYAPFSFPALSRVLCQPGYRARKTSLMAAAFLRQTRSILRSRRFDLVYLFREASLIGPALIESLVALLRTPIVFDFDDAIFVPYKSPSNGYLSFLKFFGKTARVCKISRAVMAGNSYLAEYAKRYSDDVTIVPTTIDTDVYRPEVRHRTRNNLPVIGWTGSYSTIQYLLAVAPALARLAKQRPFRLVVVGNAAPEIPGVTIEFRKWRSSTEVEDLADIDAGIMPLPDDPWSRGKCGLKALQYMALGIPPVVSPVGVNTEIVNDNVNGLVAGTEEEWIEKLRSLLTDPALRNRLGRAARQTVEERYSARVVAPRVFHVFERALSRPVSAEVEAESSRLS